MSNNERVKELNNNFGNLLKEFPEFVFAGDPILRQKSAEVSFDEGITIGNKLKDILGKYRKMAGFGRGLAAPQIGEAKAVFVTFVDEVFKTYINPKIISRSEDFNFFRESCLSCGFLSVDVKRPRSIVFQYTDELGANKEENLDGFMARLIQHEYDHLEGVLNIDRAEPGSIDFMINDPLKEKLREE